uniref:Uncharacterized protein n=1 Tax=Burkholderia sp. (strain CCGE1003) TaxID=640512 RepID=E1T7F1_BURSG
MNSKIYHRNLPDLDLVAEDFDKAFIVRKVSGSASITLYATLRVTGHDAQSSFVAAFGSEFFGHPESIALAAERFESTPTFRNAAGDAVETLGAEAIAKELAARCEEVAGFTQANAMKWRVAMHCNRAIEASTFIANGDDASFADFKKRRREEREKTERRERFGNHMPELLRSDYE